jgi:hypothetical protein
VAFRKSPIGSIPEEERITATRRPVTGNSLAGNITARTHAAAFRGWPTIANAALALATPLD